MMEDKIIELFARLYEQNSFLLNENRKLPTQRIWLLKGIGLWLVFLLPYFKQIRTLIQD